MPKRGLALLVLIVLTAAAIGPARAEIIQAGNVDLRVNTSVKPNRLPVKRKVPVEVTAAARISLQDGSPPPGLRRALVDFDVQGDIYTRGLKSCAPKRIRSASSAVAKKRCRKAFVGAGEFTAATDEVESFDGPLLIFYWRHGGRPGVLLHGYVPGPGGGEIVLARGTIKNAPGSVFGRRLDLRVPSFAGGTGRMIGVRARIAPSWRFKGKRRSFTVARCFAGNWVVRGDLTFTDDTHAQGSLIRGCKRRRR